MKKVIRDSVRAAANEGTDLARTSVISRLIYDIIYGAPPKK